VPEISPDSAAAAGAIASQYEPRHVEDVLYRTWVDRGYFTADVTSDKPPFSLVIPPPNVTGSLHLGHALEQTLMDALLRRRRMRGDEVLWLPGMDHAGIATQVLVEKHLADTEGKTRQDIGRDAFVARVWQWKEEYGGKILGQMRRLGVGVDWSRERFTMDEGLSRAVQTTFKRLYDDGLIYRAERITNWCPTDHTALSDIEVDHSEDEGELVSIRYGEGDNAVVVATTRVETMLGDTGVAVHPDDPRYQHLIGTRIELPLVGRMIPVIADTHVDPEFGTGAVKVTPAHDPNDFEIGQRHSLPMITIMDESARITVEGPYLGLTREDARRAVTEALRAEGRIVAEKRPYLHSVGHCSRCDTVIEPRLSLQWFVRVEKLAQAAGDAVRDGRVAIEPAALKPRFFDWVDNMHDWCISRQLWWGHRIPVWYGPDGETVCVGPNERPPGDGWTQDPDVLDTWFSSGQWPFSTMGWPERTADLAKFYPTSLLVTGYDILFFWVVRMMMLGLYAMDGEVPFRTVLLHGLVRDKFGKKMSKSRGNTVDPLDWMDAYGADALRFSLARGNNPGLDQPANEEWVAAARNFCNKLWNATRFAMLNGATVDGDLPTDLGPVDRWIISRLDAVTAEVDQYLEAYEFAKATASLYHFVWDEFCDWYLELAKVALNGDDAEVAAGTRRVLGEVLDVTLRLLHPFVPFVTDQLWTTLTGGESLVIAPWPWSSAARRDALAESEIAALQAVVTEVRRFRSDQGLRPSQRVPARITGLDEAGLAAHEPAIRMLARLQDAAKGFTPTATLGIGNGVTVELDLSGTLDIAAETARLSRDLAAAEKERTQTAAKLANAGFVAKAPEPVIAKIRDRAVAAEAEIERINVQLSALVSRS
jgi:valyl-tRNA synthetase